LGFDFKSINRLKSYFNSWKSTRYRYQLRWTRNKN